MQHLVAKADVLIEAMPYIQAFRGETVVIKFGGSAMEEKACHDGILTDIAFLECVGLKPVVVHGGGKAITRRMQQAGLKATFVKGLRVTDADAVRLVEEVLNHEVNPEIVETLVARGARAAGLQGPSILRAEKKWGQTHGAEPAMDLGFVGRITEVETGPIRACLAADMIPVITPLGRDAAGQIYNINADDAAAAVAKALTARKLVFLSDVPGLLRDPRDPASILSTIDEAEVGRLIAAGIIDGGMLPKIQGALNALTAGVKKVHIVDGRLAHSLLLEIFTDKGIGTEIVHHD